MCHLNIVLNIVSIIWVICRLPYEVTSRHGLILLWNYFLSSIKFLFWWKIIQIAWISLKFTSNFKLTLRFKLVALWYLSSNISLMRETIPLKSALRKNLILGFNNFLSLNSWVFTHIIAAIIWLSLKLASNLQIIF